MRRRLSGSSCWSHWGKGAAKSSVACQVSLSPPLNQASPDASSHSLPLSDDVRGCRCAGDYQERAAGVSGQGRGEVECRTCTWYTSIAQTGMLAPPLFLSLPVHLCTSVSLPLPPSSSDQLWIKFGSTLDQVRIKFGSTLDQVRINFGSSSDQLWINFGSTLDQFRIKFRSTLDQLWIKFRSTLDQVRINFGSSSDQFWTKLGSSSDQVWINFGSYYDLTFVCFFRRRRQNVDTSRTSASTRAMTSAATGDRGMGWGRFFHLHGGGYCHFFLPCAVIASFVEASRVLCFLFEFL